MNDNETTTWDGRWKPLRPCDIVKNEAMRLPWARTLRRVADGLVPSAGLLGKQEEFDAKNVRDVVALNAVAHALETQTAAAWSVAGDACEDASADIWAIDCRWLSSVAWGSGR